MKNKNNRIGMQMRICGALIGMLFVSVAIHAEGMSPDAAAASSVTAAPVAAVPTPETAAASAVPEVITVSIPDTAAASAVPDTAATPVSAPAAPEVATAPGAIPPLEERLQLCGGCHNPDGNSVIPENPKLAGLNEKYILRQLGDFKAGKRTNPTMSSIIPMVDEKEFKALAGYFSKQKRLVGVSDKTELVAKGKQIFEEGILGSAVPACMGCHGEDGSGDDKFPRINGQNPPYVINQLTNFKSGERSNDSKGLMRAVAKRMNEQEMAAVAEYVSTLKEAE